MKARIIGLAMAVVASVAFGQQQTVEVSAAPGADQLSKDRPIETLMQRARSVTFDVRNLPRTSPLKFERPERAPACCPRG